LREIFFLSSPFDEWSAEFLANLNIPAFKVASGELTNHPFLRLLARMGRPLLVSTGMATQDETRSALEAIHRAHVVPIALFHCVSNYPADPAECNLRAMDTLRAAFGAPTGWSDHTAGTEISLAAAARGADLIEKHLTLDRSLPGPDHQASLEPSELAELVRTVRTIEVALGDGIKRPMPAEAPISELVRRSLHTRRALPAGHRLRADDLVALRPGTGISPAAMDRVVDRALARSLGHFEPLAWQDLE
jgi:sialic acid synthase SpsE